MNRNVKIGVVAPLYLSKSESAYTVAFRDGKDFSIRNIHELIKNRYDVSSLPAADTFYQGDASAAGYYLTGILRASGYDTYLVAVPDDSSLQKLAAQSPDCICLSTTMLMSRSGLGDLVQSIRKYMPGVPVIAGGMYVWKSYVWHNHQDEYEKTDLTDHFLFPSNFRELGVDAFIVSSHGIGILSDILKRYGSTAKPDLTDVPNLALPIGGDGEYKFTQRVDENINVDDIGTRWDLIDDIPTRVPIRTSVGCPYRCEYCDFHSLKTGMVARSKESLLEELKILRGVIRERHPMIAMLSFTDDNVFLNSRRVTEICGIVKESKINKYWGGFVRADRINESNIDLIKSSGFYAAMVGVESGDIGQLERMSKKCDVNEVKRGIELLDEKGISTLMTLLVGFPGENESTIDNTVDYLNSIKQTNGFFSYQMYPFFIFPLSNVNKPHRRAEWNVTGMASEWSHYTINHTQVPGLMDQLFRGLETIPYYYYFESWQFLRRLDMEKKAQLYRLRNKITTDLRDNRPWEDVALRLKRMGEVLGLETGEPPLSLREQLTI